MRLTVLALSLALVMPALAAEPAPPANPRGFSAKDLVMLDSV